MALGGCHRDSKNTRGQDEQQHRSWRHDTEQLPTKEEPAGRSPTTAEKDQYFRSWLLFCGVSDPGTLRKSKSLTASAASVARSRWRGWISPDESGWIRLERNIQKVCENGSIHRQTPVKPVWPKEPIGNRSPRGRLNSESMSQPKPRRARTF